MERPQAARGKRLVTDRGCRELLPLQVLTMRLDFRRTQHQYQLCASATWLHDEAIKLK